MNLFFLKASQDLELSIGPTDSTSTSAIFRDKKTRSIRFIDSPDATLPEIGSDGKYTVFCQKSLPLIIKRLVHTRADHHKMEIDEVQCSEIVRNVEMQLTNYQALNLDAHRAWLQQFVYTAFDNFFKIQHKEVANAAFAFASASQNSLFEEELAVWKKETDELTEKEWCCVCEDVKKRGVEFEPYSQLGRALMPPFVQEIKQSKASAQIDTSLLQEFLSCEEQRIWEQELYDLTAEELQSVCDAAYEEAEKMGVEFEPYSKLERELMTPFVQEIKRKKDYARVVSAAAAAARD